MSKAQHVLTPRALRSRSEYPCSALFPGYTTLENTAVVASYSSRYTGVDGSKVFLMYTVNFNILELIKISMLYYTAVEENMAELACEGFDTGFLVSYLQTFHANTPMFSTPSFSSVQHQAFQRNSMGGKKKVWMPPDVFLMQI